MKVQFGLAGTKAGAEVHQLVNRFTIFRREGWSEFVNDAQVVSRSDGATGPIGYLNRKWLHELLDEWIEKQY